MMVVRESGQESFLGLPLSLAAKPDWVAICPHLESILDGDEKGFMAPSSVGRWLDSPSVSVVQLDGRCLVGWLLLLGIVNHSS
jgi:hypothetical protein